MDPISLAIVAAVVTGVATGLTNDMTQAGERGVLNAYNALKDLLRRKLGIDSKVNEVISDLECVPYSDGYRMVLSELLRKAKADQDPDLLGAAQVLQANLYAYPPGAQVVQQILGNYNTQATVGSAASININVPKPINVDES